MISQATLVALIFLMMPSSPSSCGKLSGSSDCKILDASFLSTYDPPKPLCSINDCYHESQTNHNVSDVTCVADFSINYRRRRRESGIERERESGRRRRGRGRERNKTHKLNRLHGDALDSKAWNKTTLFYIAFGFILVPAVASSWIFWRRKKNKLVNLRRNLFVRNGGELLQKTLSIFTAEDLNKATHNYDENNVLCQEHDHLGITYRGMLHSVTNQIVAIKFCHGFDRCNVEFLISKLISLSQISHRNVVKLLGCCVETRVPLVVYEFFTAKTLLDYLTDDCLARSLSWNIRLRIAADAAGALAHMHFATSVPIIHGNLNSFSILVDHGYTVKLHGFSLTCSECSCVQFYGGRSGYLDPDYCLFGRLTEKSDVYSFGFIMAELLTGKDVMSPEWLEGEDNLAKYFVGSTRGGDLLGILDDRVVTDDNRVQLTRVAEIAKRCLSSSSQERPTMKEVAAALECIKIREF